MAKQVIDDQRFTGIRLPKTIKPVHYDMSLKPNFADFTFAGKVKISYKSEAEAPKDIVLHSNELEITEGSLEVGAESSPLTTVTYSPATETATLEFKNGIAPEGIINLTFSGKLNDRMKGFYRTTFKIGESAVIAATTQFEATDARRCFPCWDEPAIKATFTVTMVIEKYMTVNGQQYERLALSNMPEQSRTGPDTEVAVTFEKTPIMSTYLLAFIVGPFDVVEGSDGRRPIRVYTTPGKKEQGRFALEVACKSLPYYEDYFDIKYPLPKMDLIAIPDFMSGAMENWGLVTYRETCVLFDPENTSTDRKQWIAIVVAHELAHQWFGNLVTMEWWTHLWLNEGFASFMEYLCVDHIFPEYDIWSQFVTDSYGSAMRLDAMHSSHPIEVPVKHSSEIDEIFDDISYAKGATIIRMLYTYIGDDNFRKGMKDYLTKFAYKNAETEDLWDCLEAASNKPVRKLMSGWTAQKGYPWLSLSYAKEGDNVKLTITQDKFSADGTVPDGDAQSSWMVPITVVTGNKPDQSQEVCLLEGKTGEVTLQGVGDNWVKLNPGTIGLYVTAYPEAMTSKLHPAIMQLTLPPPDRLGLQSEFYSLCKAGKVGSTELLKLLLSFKQETNYPVWNSIDTTVGHLGLLVSHTHYGCMFEAFGRQLYGEIFKKVGWTARPNEEHTMPLIRALVIRRLVSLKHDGVIEEARRLYKQQQDGLGPVPADLRGAVYRAAAMYGDDETFESLFKIYRTAEMSEEKCRALGALGYSPDGPRLKRVLDMCVTEEVRKQDKIFIIMSASVNSPATTWEFFKQNAAYFRDEYGVCHLRTSIVKSTSQNFVTEERAQEVLKFFDENKFPGSEMAIKQSAEKIRLNAAWWARDGEAIKAFLANY